MHACNDQNASSGTPRDDKSVISCRLRLPDLNVDHPPRQTSITEAVDSNLCMLGRVHSTIPSSDGSSTTTPLAPPTRI
eukprot:scaffold61898_cov72-Phaeocystis_antarctica.AAC.4